MRKGSLNLDFLLVSCLIFLVSIVALENFGGHISAFFDNQPVDSTFSKDRHRFTAESQKTVLSDTNIVIDGQNYIAPTEKAIIDKLKNNQMIETSGTYGDIKNHVTVLNAYIDQLEDIINKNTEDENDISNLLLAISQYKETINQYIEKDNVIVSSNDPLLKVINDLNVSLELSKDGESAVELANATIKALNKFDNNQKVKNIIGQYVNDIISLGESIDHSIDSRKRQEIAEISATISEENGDYTTDYAYSDSSSPSASAWASASSGPGSASSSASSSSSFGSASASASSSSSSSSSYSSASASASSSSSASASASASASSPTTVKTQILIQELKNIYNDTNLSEEQKEEIAKQVHVYRSGTYFDILPNSYNTEVLGHNLDSVKIDNINSLSTKPQDPTKNKKNPKLTSGSSVTNSSGNSSGVSSGSSSMNINKNSSGEASGSSYYYNSTTSNFSSGSNGISSSVTINASGASGSSANVHVSTDGGSSQESSGFAGGSKSNYNR